MKPPNEGKTANQSNEERIRTAYKMSKKLVYSRIREEDEENIQVLESLENDDIIVVKGTYDYIERVLSLLDMPYLHVSINQLPQLKLRPDQTIFVNCPSSFDPSATRPLVKFVESGGQLITTDWALKHVIEVAFPGYIAWNQQTTADEVVRIELVDKEDPLIQGFLDEKSDPLWWLEGSSYPIKILDKEKVKVLIRSKEIGQKYKDDPVMVKFEVGEGVVYHMISHFYLQRTETREKKHEESAVTYVAEKVAAPEAIEELKMEMEDMDLNYAEMQSAGSSSEFVTRAILNQKKKKK